MIRSRFDCETVVADSHGEGKLYRVQKWVRDSMVFRTLQIDRSVTSDSLAKALGGTDELRKSFGGLLGTLNNEAAVVADRVPAVRPDGRAVRRWVPGEQAAVLRCLASRKVRPLPPEALARIRGNVPA